MRRGLLILIYTAVMVWSAFAQDQTDRAKYELIRETINFLATDKAVSQDTSFRISCETLDYDCFKQQLSSNPIAGIERWYNAWRSMTATDEAGLVTLRKQVFADIFERPGKGYRKQLAGYKAYITRTESLIRSSVDEVPVDRLTTDSTEAPPEHPAQSNNSIYPEQTSVQNENPEKEDTMIAYFALTLAVIALIIVALPLFKKKEQQLAEREQQPAADFYGLQERLGELAVRMKHLEQKLSDSQLKNEAITSLTEIMESVEKRVVELENNSNVG